MNIFFLLKTSDGGLELVTPGLDTGDILPGVTRDSILALCRSWGHNSDPSSLYGGGRLTVSEREVTMGELIEASKQGQVRYRLYLLINCLYTVY